MNINKVLDSIYLIPAILDHLDHPTQNTKSILVNNGVANESDLETLSKLRHLLEYHLHIIQNKYSPNYELLRDGLVEYFNQYLSDVFLELGFEDKQLYMMDYCCGAGQYGKQFKELNPDSFIHFVDKVINPELFKTGSCSAINFETNPNWHKPFNDSADVILLSEILHCKNRKWQNYLIHSSHKILKDKGQLIIIENIDHCMEFRIKKLKSDNSIKLLSEHDIYNLTCSSFKFLKKIDKQRHNIYLHEKI